jgi:TonB family protein
MKCLEGTERLRIAAPVLGDARRVTLPLSALAHAVFAAAVVVLPVALWHELPPVPERGITLPVFVPSAAVQETGSGEGGGASVTTVRLPVVRTQIVLPQKLERNDASSLATEGEADLTNLLDERGLGPVCIGDCRGRGSSGAGFVVPAPTPTPTPQGPLLAGRGGLVREPRKIHHVEPIYPSVARAARLQGRAALTCTLATDGSVSEINVDEGSEVFVPAAVEAVRAWRYQPTLLNGVPVAVRLTVVVSFRLH